jgi:hypothetical protein
MASLQSNPTTWLLHSLLKCCRLCVTPLFRICRVLQAAVLEMAGPRFPPPVPVVRAARVVSPAGPLRTLQARARRGPRENAQDGAPCRANPKPAPNAIEGNASRFERGLIDEGAQEQRAEKSDDLLRRVRAAEEGDVREPSYFARQREEKPDRGAVPWLLSRAKRPSSVFAGCKHQARADIRA